MTTMTTPDVELVESIAPRASDLVEALMRTLAERADKPEIEELYA